MAQIEKAVMDLPDGDKKQVRIRREIERQIEEAESARLDSWPLPCAALLGVLGTSWAKRPAQVGAGHLPVQCFLGVLGSWGWFGGIFPTPVFEPPQSSQTHLFHSIHIIHRPCHPLTIRRPSICSAV